MRILLAQDNLKLAGWLGKAQTELLRRRLHLRRGDRGSCADPEHSHFWFVQRNRLDAGLLDGGAEKRGTAKRDELSAGIRLLNLSARGEHRVLLHVGWYRSDEFDGGYGKELAHLLESDLGVASRDDDTDPLMEVRDCTQV